MTHFDQIRQWAADRNLIEGATPQAQFVKLMEEAGELAAGIAKSRQEAVVDGIGDMVVVLTILAAQHGVTIEDCIATAYTEIKDRKGRMLNGCFVKEADLPKGEWIAWNGGPCPVDVGTLVDVRHRDGEEFGSQAAGVYGPKPQGYAHVWHHHGAPGDIVAYRVVQQLKTVDLPADDWIEWVSELKCPVARGTLVEVKYRDGVVAGPFPSLDNTPSLRDAGVAFWHQDGAANDIVAYRVVQP